DQGQVVGYSGPGGFVYDIATQTFTPIQYPHANPTYALAINNSGMIVGYFRQNGINTGFEYFNGKFRAIAYPGSSETFVQAVSDTNLVIGSATGLGSNQSFVLRQGNYDLITIPGATEAWVTGINPKGTTLVGYYDTFSGFMGFVYKPSQGTERTVAFH